MKVIRASEIGTYRFCKRAWWYQIQGYQPDNRLEMAIGQEYHKRHWFFVTASGCLQAVAYGLVLLAIISAIIWLIEISL
jgi:hypothetical protein